MADSAYGVTRGAASGRYSTALPNNLAAASAWDPQAAFEYGALIGRELRAEGYSMSLGGGVNLSREPRNGRTFEYQGEDPLLAGTLVGNFVKGVQSLSLIHISCLTPVRVCSPRLGLAIAMQCGCAVLLPACTGIADGISSWTGSISCATSSTSGASSGTTSYCSVLSNDVPISGGWRIGSSPGVVFSLEL